MKKTNKYHLAAMLIVSSKCLSFLKKSDIHTHLSPKSLKIMDWFTSIFDYTLKNLNETTVDADIFHNTYFGEHIPEYGGYFYQYPKENGAFFACWLTLYYASKYFYDLKDTKNNDIPSPINEVDDACMYECFEFAQRAFENTESEKKWQESLVAHLLKDYVIDASNEPEKPINRRYMEELLGEALPF